MESKEERSLFRDECNKKATEMKVIYNIDDIYLYKQNRMENYWIKCKSKVVKKKFGSNISSNALNYKIKTLENIQRNMMFSVIKEEKDEMNSCIYVYVLFFC